MCALARKEPFTFASMLLHDERTGKRVTMHGIHKQMHSACDRHKTVMIWAFVESGKSHNISVARVLWEIGNNPNIRIMLVSKTAELSRKLMNQVRAALEGNSPAGKVMRMVFPDVVIDETQPLTNAQLTVRRTNSLKDPTVSATSKGSNSIHGARVDLLIFDDILDPDSVLTQHQRDKDYDWCALPISRMSGDDPRVWVLGNALHPDDAYHRLVNLNGFTPFRFSAIGADGEPVWPEMRGYKWLEFKKRTLGPFSYPKMVLCQAFDDSAARIQRKWVEDCLLRGQGLKFPIATREAFHAELAGPNAVRLGFAPGAVAPGDIAIYCGVDLAVQKHSAADESSFVVVGLLPDGTRRLLAVESGRWGSPEIRKRMREIYQRYGCTFWVENVGSQDLLIQDEKAISDIPIHGFTTGSTRAKPEFIMERLAISLADTKWVLPCQPAVEGVSGGHRMDPEIFNLTSEMYAYDPRSHVGDRVMAMVFANEACLANDIGPSYGITVGGAGWRTPEGRGF